MSGSAPQETQEESEHQQVPQKETLQVSIAPEVRRPRAPEAWAFVPDERCIKFHLNPSLDSLVSSPPADTRRRRRRIRKGNEIARPTKMSAAKSASSPATRRRRARTKTRRGSESERRRRSERRRGSERRNQRARKETSRSGQTRLTPSGFSRSVLKLPPPPQVTRDYDEEEQGYDSEKEREERKYSDDSALSPQSAEGNGTSRPHKVKANGADNDDMDVSD